MTEELQLAANFGELWQKDKPTFVGRFLNVLQSSVSEPWNFYTVQLALSDSEPLSWLECSASDGYDQTMSAHIALSVWSRRI